MIISERMFQIMKEKNMSQTDLSRATGIATQTISDWKRKKTNPGADKIMVICQALNITPEELLLGTPKEVADEPAADSTEEQFLQKYRALSENSKKRMLAYMTMLENLKEKKQD